MNVHENVVLVLALSALARMRGLLGTTRRWGDGNRVLALIPCKSVHTFGMRYAIDIAFASKSGLVLKSCRNVQPCKRIACKKAYYVLERPCMPHAWWPRPGDALPLLLHQYGHCGEAERCDQQD